MLATSAPLVDSAAGAAPFHVARSTRWPSRHFGYDKSMTRSNLFAGALILRNCSATSQSGVPCCSIPKETADPLDERCYTPPSAIRDALSTVPRGQKLIGMLDGASNLGGLSLHDPDGWDPIPGGFFGPWADSFTQIVSDKWRRWLTAFKAVGGEVDVLFADIEWSGWQVRPGVQSWAKSFAAQRSPLSNSTRVWQPMMLDPRWPALRARLEAAGAEHGVTFSNQSMAQMGEWTSDPRDMRSHVWNSVMYTRMAEVINRSFYEPAASVFFDVKFSSYSHSYVPPPAYWTYQTDSSEHHPPFAGRGTHAGTHQSKSMYAKAAQVSEQCSVTDGESSQRMAFCWIYGTPFWQRKFVPSPVEYGSLLHLVTRARGLTVAAPTVPWSPWIAPKASTLYPPPGGTVLAHSDYYQEVILHMALAGAREFLYWHYGPGGCCWGAQTPCDGLVCPDGQPPQEGAEEITVGVDLLNAVLSEADEMVGADGRQVLELEAPHEWDPFVLSGVAMPEGWRGGAFDMYRFTPRGNATVVSALPATFRVPGMTGDVVPVPGGELVGPDAPCSTAGFWIVRPREPKGIFSGMSGLEVFGIGAATPLVLVGLARVAYEVYLWRQRQKPALLASPSVGRRNDRESGLTLSARGSNNSPKK